MLCDLACCIMIIYIIPPSAAGLYYLAELIEEFSVIAKKIITALVAVRYSVYYNNYIENSTYSSSLSSLW